MAVRALIFDFDGLILDTEVPEYEAWRHAFEHVGAEPLSFDEWCVTIGTQDVLDPVALLRERVGAFDEDAVAELRRTRNRELIEAQVVLPGVEAWLDDAHRLGLLTAVASSSPTEWVDGHLRRLGLVDRFVHLSCFGGALRAKPAPDLYLAACEAVGVDASNAVAVEDSPNGIAAAKAAGLRCVTVPNRMTRHLDLSAADLVLDSLADLPLEEVVARFS